MLLNKEKNPTEKGTAALSQLTVPKPQTTIPRSQTIAYRIEQMILEGDLIPKQKIPSERQLAEKLAVSRSIVREALKELQGRGLIETRHGQGSFVSEIVAAPEDKGPFMQLFFGHSKTLYDLYEVREQLEGQAASLAAERGTQKDFYRITKAFDGMANFNSKSRQSPAELDHRFHQAIVEASHNAVLVHTLNSLNQLVLHSVQASVSNLSHRESFKLQIDKHHQQIYKAIINQQPERAKKAAMAHVRHVSESLQKIEEHEQSIVRKAIGPD